METESVCMCAHTFLGGESSIAFLGFSKGSTTPKRSRMGIIIQLPHVPEEKTEAQKGDGICPKVHRVISRPPCTVQASW